MTTWRYARNELETRDMDSNQLKIQCHFSRAYACFVKYFLMIQKLHEIRKLAYIPSFGTVVSSRLV